MGWRQYSFNIPEEGDKEALLKNLQNSETVLDGLVIDRETDPNSMDTGRRPAKMYKQFHELMSGRYLDAPQAAFPMNDNITNEKYEGMLVVRSELKTLLPSPPSCCWCSIHWTYWWLTLNPSPSTQESPQWCVRRGTPTRGTCYGDSTLEISKATGPKMLVPYLAPWLL